MLYMHVINSGCYQVSDLTSSRVSGTLIDATLTGLDDGGRGQILRVVP